MTVPGPVVPRRRIGDVLRRLRDESGLTLEDVATELMISTSKLSRLENAQGSPQARDVRDLIRFYRIEGTRMADQLSRWVKASHRQNWWANYTKRFPADLATHISYEDEASISRLYTIPVLPVLLQTADYAREYYRTAETWWTSEEAEQLVEVRMKRQRALWQRDDREPLKLIAVTHEASIRQLVGSEAIMREQLAQLVERSTEPNVELRILPFNTAPLFTITCMYGHFEFSDELDRDVVWVESHAGSRTIETERTVKEYRAHHDALREAALPPDETRALIREVSKERFS